jgi:hypothetical protein
MPPIVFGEDGAVIPESPSTLSICAGVAEGKAHKLSVLALTPPFELPASSEPQAVSNVTPATTQRLM